jgi:hypothetical protein
MKAARVLRFSPPDVVTMMTGLSRSAASRNCCIGVVNFRCDAAVRAGDRAIVKDFRAAQ